MYTLVTGGTGSVGHVLVEHLLRLRHDVLVFSRDESKQHAMRAKFPSEHLRFQIGNVRDPDAVAEAVKEAHRIIHCAAMKHVPSCEKAPYEAVQTNIMGTYNLVRAVRDAGVATHFIAISTDKACEPIGVMGQTKAIMERIVSNAGGGKTRFISVRFGNVVPSRGSVFPYFKRLIEEGKPLTVTSERVTRFLLPLSDVPGVVFNAMQLGRDGEVFVPRLGSAYITDIARSMRGDKDIPIVYIGMRSGEKHHELLVSAEEVSRTTQWGDYYVIHPHGTHIDDPIPDAISSRYSLLRREQLDTLLSEALT